MKKIISVVLVLLLSFNNVYAFDGISAKAYILMEQSTGTVIVEKNSNVKMKPASTTKILTAICAIENSRLTDIVTVSKKAAYQEGSSVYLKPGDQISMEDLVYGLMLNSGNDAAVAIAEHISDDTEKFSFFGKFLGIKLKVTSISSRTTSSVSAIFASKLSGNE